MAYCDTGYGAVFETYSDEILHHAEIERAVTAWNKSGKPELKVSMVVPYDEDAGWHGEFVFFSIYKGVIDFGSGTEVPGTSESVYSYHAVSKNDVGGLLKDFLQTINLPAVVTGFLSAMDESV